MWIGLWRKAIHDAWALLFALTVLLFGFHWIFIWLVSKVSLPAMTEFLLNAIPQEWEGLSGVPFKEVATPTGRIALALVDPVVVFSMSAWGIARGSDVVSGELGRGGLELFLSQPVSRVAWLATQTTVTIMGTVILACAAWCGLWCGIQTVEAIQGVSPRDFVPGVANLCALGIMLAGISTLLSAWGSQRGKTIGIMTGFYVVQMIIKLVGRMAEPLSWLQYVSVFTAFEPQVLVSRADEAWSLFLWYDGPLLAIGGIAYILAAIRFATRDIPAPL